jgi:hypothetical protein
MGTLEFDGEAAARLERMYGIDAAEACAWRAELRESADYSFSLERSVFLLQRV